MIPDLPSEFADSFMCSFDSSSLFTNVLLDDVINICADYLICTGNISTFSRETFVELMNFATRSVEFSFNNIVYPVSQKKCREFDAIEPLDYHEQNFSAQPIV